MKFNKKNNLIKKTIIFSMIALMFFNFNIKKASAEVWFAAFGAEVMHEAWAEAKEKFIGETLARIKRNFMKNLNGRMSSLAEKRRITDFNEYLSGEVNSEVNLFKDEYFTTLDTAQVKRPGEYVDEMDTMIKGAISNDMDSSNESQLSSIEKDYIHTGSAKENLFKEQAGGGLSVLPVFLQPNNNPLGKYLLMSTKLSNSKEKIEEAQKVAATSSGFRGDGEGDNAKAASVYAEMAAKAETSEIDLIANATNITELAGLTGEGFDLQDFTTMALKTGKKMMKDQLKQQWRGIYQGGYGMKLIRDALGRNDDDKKNEKVEFNE